MLYEFAIEPEVLTTWTLCRVTLNLMGFQHARAIAAYPTKKRWKKLVFEACERGGCADRELHRIVEKVHGADAAMVRSGPWPYDHQMLPESDRWLLNAISCQSTGARFHAVLATRNPTGEPTLVLEEDIDSSHPLLDVRRSHPVLRQPVEMAAHVSTLLRESHSILLIDPHFDPNAPRWRPVVSSLLAAATEAGVATQRIEIHALDNDSKCSFREFAAQCQRHLPQLFPPGLRALRVVRWRTRVELSDDFHARYILTERGGYKLDKGLDEEHGRAQEVELIEEGHRARIWAAYQEPSPVFEKDDAHTILPAPGR